MLINLHYIEGSPRLAASTSHRQSVQAQVSSRLASTEKCAPLALAARFCRTTSTTSPLDSIINSCPATGWLGAGLPSARNSRTCTHAQGRFTLRELLDRPVDVTLLPCTQTMPLKAAGTLLIILKPCCDATSHEKSGCLLVHERCQEAQLIVELTGRQIRKGC